MQSRFYLIIIFFIGFSSLSQSIYKRDLGIMGSKFDITVVANSQQKRINILK